MIGARALSIVVALTAACTATPPPSNVIGQPDLTQDELDQITADAKLVPDAGPELPPGQTEMTVSSSPEPPERKAPRPHPLTPPPPTVKHAKIHASGATPTDTPKLPGN